jgi:hypothetical protein
MAARAGPRRPAAPDNANSAPCSTSATAARDLNRRVHTSGAVRPRSPRPTGAARVTAPAARAMSGTPKALSAAVTMANASIWFTDPADHQRCAKRVTDPAR